MTTTDTSKCCGGDCSTVEEQVTSTPTYRPKFDWWVGDDGVVLKGDLPGVSPEQLELEYEDGTLSIRANVRDRLPETGVLRREYGIGNFQRKFQVGHEIDASAITAHLDGGVLTLVLPLQEKAKPRRIDVNVA